MCSKYFLAGFLIQLVAFSTLFGKETSAQLSDTIEGNFRTASVQSIFSLIRAKTNLSFVYDSKQVDENAVLHFHRTTMTVAELLDSLSSKMGLSFKQIGNTITVKGNSRPSNARDYTLPFIPSTRPIVPSTTTGPRSPFLAAFTVSGTVTDTAGGPLIGVSVVIKGTSTGTVTDATGHYQIDATKAATLVFSYVGFQNKEVPVNGNSLVNVQLTASNTGLNEVVVVGYGTQKKMDLTGAVSVVSQEDIERRSVSTLAKALQGADPSMNITYGTGVPDQGYGINVRGVPSINGGSPLILMDGVEVSLNEVNPHDVAAVTILKDAAAAAIYGAKASSGVVLITSKEGSNKDGQATITYEGRFGILENTTSTDYIRTGYDYVKMTNTFYRAYAGYDNLLYDDQEMQMLLDRRNDFKENPKRPWTYMDEQGRYLYYGNTDWYGYFYRRQRPQQEHNVSIAGGGKNIKYYASGRLLSQDGIFNIYHDNFKNYSFYTKIDAKIKPWLNYTGSASYNNSVYKFAGYLDPQYTVRALQTNVSPSFIPFNPDGSIVEYTNQLHANSPIGAGHGGFLTANDARNSRGNKYIVLSNKLDFSLLKHLTITGAYAYKHRERRNRYRNMPFEYSRQQGVFATVISGTIYDYLYKDIFDVDDHNLNVYATYDNMFNNDHHLKVVAGGQYEDYREVDLGVKQLGQLSRDLGAFSLGTGEITLSNTINAFRTLGFFGRVNYDYKNKYLLQMSGRYDGTSRFAPSDRWGFFPSMALGWVMNRENFWSNLQNIFNFAKLRFSYGSLGNQQVDYYAYIDEISANNTMNYTFDGKTQGIYASVSNPISPSLTWETVTTYNLGLDLQSLNNRLSFSADLFIRNTRNMLAQSLTLPDVFGASTPLGNVADLQTKGYEFKLGWEDDVKVLNKNLHYSVSATLGNYNTVITKFNNPDKLISDWYVGKRFGDIWGYKVKGLFPTDDAAAQYQLKINDKAANNRVYASKENNFLRAGDVQFIDVNGDGIINEGSGTVADPGDKVIIGNSQPKFNYSLRLGLDWNHFDLSVFLQGVGKRDWWPSTYSYDFWGPYSYPLVSFIQKDFLANTWSEDNPNAYFPRPRGYQSYTAGSMGVANDRYLQNVAYLRLRSLVIGYSIPFKSGIIHGARIYFSGENLFYLSKLKQHSMTVDPELTVTGATYDTNSGVGYPFSKSFNFGLRLTF